MKYIFGIIIIAVGMSMVIKTEWFLSFFGRVAWAEAKLGAEGGTRIFYKLLGLAFIFFSVMMISGRITSIFDWIFVPPST